MGFGVFFVPLVGGYLFLKYCHYTRFSIRRASGHKLVLESAVMGLVLMALARIGISAVGMLTVSLDWAGETWAKLAPFPHAGTVTLAFVLGPLLARLVNIFYPESRGLTRTIDDAGNTMELLFVESMASDSTVELTMLNGHMSRHPDVEKVEPRRRGDALASGAAMERVDQVADQGVLQNLEVRAHGLRADPAVGCDGRITH